MSHACWLLTYPLAGWAGARLGLGPTSVLLGVVAALAVGLAVRLWPASSDLPLEHEHPGLPATHPHWAEGVRKAHGARHAHPAMADELHAYRPS